MKDFNDYYKAHKDRAASPLLQRALTFVTDTSSNKKALELGAGLPTDALFLADNHFSVTAVDLSPESATAFETINNPAITFLQKSFTDIPYPEQEYDFINAQRALPFIPDKDTLFEIIKKIKGALKPGGVFSGQLFGVNDEWSKEDKGMTFVDRAEFEMLFQDMRVVHKVELEEDGIKANGNPKHWHIFHIIAIKK
jgi:SAM-dependent methyltransferase